VATAQIIAAEASQFMQQAVFGVILCRSAGGVTIAANRFAHVRAVAATDVATAVHARVDNAANILTLSGDRLTQQQAIEIVTAFCSTQFSNAERHVRRLQQIEAFAHQQN
jgi:ribose 5-phosphate isomerase B